MPPGSTDLLSALLQALRDNAAALAGLSADQENLIGTVRDLRAAIERLTAVVDRRLAVDEDRDKQVRDKRKFFEKLANSKAFETILRLLIFGAVGTDLGMRIWPPTPDVKVVHADPRYTPALPESVDPPSSGANGASKPAPADTH